MTFKKAPMVRWFDPFQLIQTGIRKAISETFGDYADKREMQAALALDIEVADGKVSRKGDKPLEYPRAGEGDPARRDGGNIWIDYVADLGDGFEATYTIAYLLAQAELAVQGGPSLPRGDILVMGGDQVYPTPSRAGYKDKLIGPYGAALPDAEPMPHLYAIPGNHDWYDGLANFLRFFCMKRRIGGWETKQTRSYFAAKLPKGWWLWGLDIQFEGYIDEPQLEYFDSIAKKLDAGDRILLVTGKPSWMDAPAEESPQYENLRYLEEYVIEPQGRGGTKGSNPPRVPVMISGDDHYYAHFFAKDKGGWRHKITSGGGGAFLSATHHMRKHLNLPRGPAAATTLDTYTLERVYPARLRSWILGLRTLLLLASRNWVFLWAVAVAYLGPALLLKSQATRQVGQGDDGSSLREFWLAVMWTEWAAWAGAVIWALLFLYAAVKSVLGRALVAAVHATAHVFVVGSATALSARGLDSLAREFGEGNPIRTGIVEGDLTVALLGTVLATIPGAVVVGLYLIVMDGLAWVLDRILPRRSQRFPRHVMELFAAQRITGHKNFLRMRIDGESGALTIFPIAVPKAAKFTFPPATDPRPSLLVPKQPIEWRLIEQPIVVDGALDVLGDLGGAPVE